MSVGPSLPFPEPMYRIVLPALLRHSFGGWLVVSHLHVFDCLEMILYKLN